MSIKKYKEDILNFFVFGIMILAIVISRNLNNFDEVWIFNMARNIANGLLPYKDFNLVVTPGLPIICGQILKLLGTEMFIMRILATIVDTIIIFMIYKILKLLNVNKYLSTFISLFIAGLFIESFCIDYNFMILMLALICLYFELKQYQKTEKIFEYNIKTEILLGLLAGISIAMKQTTGICFAIAFIGYKLLAVRTREEFKKILKIAITRLIAVIIPVILLIIYLVFNNIMGDFIDYAILGISDFSNSKPYINLLKGDLWLLALLVPIMIISSFIISIKKKDDVLLTLFAYSVSTIIVVYPIADTIHFLIAGTITMITGIYMMLKFYEDKLKEKTKKEHILWATNFIKAFTNIFLILIIVISTSRTIGFISQCSKYNNLQNFNYIPVSEELEQRILKIGEYIKNSEDEVYILDASAALYMVPLNRYNKNYDMFMKGNFGVKGSQGIIESLQTKKDETILILNDERSMNWQTPKEVIRYIKDNYVKIGGIENFDAYKMKK